MRVLNDPADDGGIVPTQYLYIAIVLVVLLVCVFIFALWRSRSRSTTRARDWLQRRDPAAVVFVSARPSHISGVLEPYSATGLPVLLPALFPVVVDAAGISYFSSGRSPVPLASIPWTSIGGIGLTDAWLSDDGWHDSKRPVLGVEIDDGREIVFYVCHFVAGRWEPGAESHQLVREIEATRAT
ncbi:MAG: hypothetical protein JWQ43_3086 [Glaciihabitans sp.]|nr:hypothetical protein [Glaciihabitans sp.]